MNQPEQIIAETKNYARLMLGAPVINVSLTRQEEDSIERAVKIMLDEIYNRVIAKRQPRDR